MNIFKDILNKKFGIIADNISLIRKGPDNDVHLVKENDKKYIVRVAKRNGFKDFLFEVELISHLREKGIKVPKIIYSKNHLPFVSNKNILALSVFEFIEGNHFDFSKSNKKEVYYAGEGLADFHNATVSFKAKQDITRNIYTEFKRLIKNKKEILKMPQGDKFIREVEETVEWAEKTKEKNYYIHNDYRPGNVFFKNENLEAIIDFNWSCPGPHIKDVAHSFMEWSYPDGAAKPFRENEELFLEGYNKKALHKIKKDQTFFRWVCFSALSDVCTYLVDDKNYEKVNDLNNSYMYQKYTYYKKFTIFKNKHR